MDTNGMTMAQHVARVVGEGDRTRESEHDLGLDARLGRSRERHHRVHNDAMRHQRNEQRTIQIATYGRAGGVGHGSRTFTGGRDDARSLAGTAGSEKPRSRRRGYELGALRAASSGILLYESR